MYAASVARGSTEASAGRDVALESLRGFTIMGVVVYHSFDPQNAGAWAAAFAYVFAFFDPVIMPLFAAVSGYVYAMRSRAPHDFKGAVGRKVNRILVPFAIAVSVMYLLRWVVSGPHTLSRLAGLGRALLFTYEYFWFIQALFVVFIIAAALDRWRVLDRPVSAGAALAASLVWGQVAPGPSFMSLWGAWYLLPAFLLGFILCRHRVPRAWTAVAGAVFIGAEALLHSIWFDQLEWRTERTAPLGMVAGLSGAWVLLTLRFPSATGAWLGERSYVIYLYHGLGLAVGARLPVERLGMDPSLTTMVLKVIFGLAVPAILASLLVGTRVGRVVLGGKW